MFTRSWHSVNSWFEAALHARYYSLLFIWGLAEGALIFIVPIFLEVHVNNLFEVGIFLAICNFAGLICDVLFGMVVEVSGFLNYLYIGVILSTLLVLFMVFGTGTLAYIIIAVLWGAEFELFFNFGCKLYLAQHWTGDSFKQISASAYVVRGLAFFAAPILADRLYTSQPTFLYVYLLAIYAFIFIFLITKFDKKHRLRLMQHSNKKVERLSFMDEWKVVKGYLPSAGPFLVLTLGISIFEAVFINFSSIEFYQYTTNAGLLSALSVLLSVSISLILGNWLSDKIDKKVSFIVCLLIIFFCLPFIVVGDPILLAVSAVLAFAIETVIFWMLDSGFMGMLSKVKRQDEDEVLFLQGFMNNFAYIIVAIIGGFFIADLGFYFTLLIGAVCMLVCLGLFVITTKRNDRRRTSPKMHS